MWTLNTPEKMKLSFCFVVFRGVPDRLRFSGIGVYTCEYEYGLGRAEGGPGGRSLIPKAQAVKKSCFDLACSLRTPLPPRAVWRGVLAPARQTTPDNTTSTKRNAPRSWASYALTLTRGMIDRGEKHRQPLRRTAQPATSPSTPHPSAPLAHSLPPCKVRKFLVAPAEAAGRPAKSSRQVAGVGPLAPFLFPAGCVTPARGMLRLAGVGGERPDVGPICGWGWSRRSADGDGSGDAAWWRGRAFPGWGVCASQLTRALEACPPR